MRLTNAPDMAAEQSSSPMSAEVVRIRRNLNDTGQLRDTVTLLRALVPGAVLAVLTV